MPPPNGHGRRRDYYWHTVVTAAKRKRRVDLLRLKALTKRSIERRTERLLLRRRSGWTTTGCCSPTKTAASVAENADETMIGQREREYVRHPPSATRNRATTYRPNEYYIPARRWFALGYPHLRVVRTNGSHRACIALGSLRTTASFIYRYIYI